MMVKSYLSHSVLALSVLIIEADVQLCRSYPGANFLSQMPNSVKAIAAHERQISISTQMRNGDSASQTNSLSAYGREKVTHNRGL